MLASSSSSFGDFFTFFTWRNEFPSPSLRACWPHPRRPSATSSPSSPGETSSHRRLCVHVGLILVVLRRLLHLLHLEKRVPIAVSACMLASSSSSFGDFFTFFTWRNEF